MTDRVEVEAFLAVLQDDPKKAGSVLDTMSTIERVGLVSKLHQLIQLSWPCRICSKTILVDGPDVSRAGFGPDSPRVHTACLQAQGAHITPSGQTVPKHEFRPGYGDHFAICRTCQEKH